MSDERIEEMLAQVRETYHVPNEPPREAMWAAIEGRIGGTPAGRSGGTEPGGDQAPVVDLAVERARREAARPHVFRSTDRSMGWAVAAAAVLVLGIGIGRMTAPAGAPQPVAEGVPGPADPDRGALQLAAREHLGRTESLLTMVRADARAGRIDPATSEWAEGLLSETRLLLDADRGADPAVEDLLLDLELVLIQITAVAETGSMDEARARTELELALRTLDEGEVLPRIQAVLPELEGA
jgi:hypothetical protein